jgi:hypothetical protein
MSTQLFVLLQSPSDLGLVRFASTVGRPTVLTGTGEEAPSPLLAAQLEASGAERWVRLVSDALELTDYLGKAFALANLVRRVSQSDAPVVIFAGEEGRGAVGPALAERLGIPSLHSVTGCAMSEGSFVALQRLATGERVLRSAGSLLVTVPAVAGVDGTTGVSTPTLRVETWSLQQAGLSAAELRFRRRYRLHPVTPDDPNHARFVELGRQLRPAPLESAHALAERLLADGTIPRGAR